MIANVVSVIEKNPKLHEFKEKAMVYFSYETFADKLEQCLCIDSYMFIYSLQTTNLSEKDRKTNCMSS